jgi:cysteine desulfurase
MNIKTPIYLDYHATTPLDPRVLEKMIPYFTQDFGNASSRNHAFGWTAEAAVEKARNQIALLIGGTEKEIVFTSGATESNNLAILGVAEQYKDKGNHIISCLTEHKAVIDPLKHLEETGQYEITWLNVNSYGQIDLEELKKAIRPTTILISIMHGNNEIGTIQDVAAIGKIAHENGVLFHTDAVQTVGKVPIDVEKMNIDLLSLSAHKVYGPKGIGALYVRRRNPRVRISPIVFGGGHERGMRSGTLNVPGIVGLGEACEIAQKEMATESERIKYLREYLFEGLKKELDQLFLNGHPTERLPGNLNISFAFVEGEALMMGIKDIAVSSGSACTSASLEPSYVLKALGVTEDLAHTSIRFGLGRFTTKEEIDFVIQRTLREVKRLRDMSPLYEMVKEGIDLKSVQWTSH